MLELANNISRLDTENAFNVLARVQVLENAGRDVINLGIGQPDFKTAEHIVSAAVKALRDGHHGYTPAPGIAPLREAVAESIETYYTVSIHPDRILIVPGGKVSIFFTILLFGEPGVDILYPNPSFPIYESLIKYTGANPIPIPRLGEFNFDFTAEAVLESITPLTRLIILNFPANPTGEIAAKTELDKLVKGLERFPQVAILSDEIYSRICYGSRHISLIEYPEIHDQLILLNGWSKTYAMTGWRLGYSIWPPAIIKDAIKLAINCHSCVNTATQFAGIAALAGPQNVVESMVQEFKHRRDFLIEGLNGIDGISCATPGGAFYAFPNVARLADCVETLQDDWLERLHVATVAGTSFGRYGQGFLRLSYVASMARIEEALHRIKQHTVR